MKQAATVISFVLNPFIMPLLGVILALKYHSYFSILYRQDMVNTLVILGLLLTLLFPLISIYVLFRAGMISDVQLGKREERMLPSIITLCYFMAYYYFLSRVDGLHDSVLSGFLGGCMALAISIFITTKWKISLHAQGISSLAGMFIGITQVTFADHFYMIIFLLVSMGLVGTSRLILNKHTPLQVYAGAILGFVLPYLFVVNELTIG